MEEDMVSDIIDLILLGGGKSICHLIFLYPYEMGMRLQNINWTANKKTLGSIIIFRDFSLVSDYHFKVRKGAAAVRCTVVMAEFW